MGYTLTLIARFFETLIASIGAHLSFSLSGIFLLAFPVSFSFAAYTMTILQEHWNFSLPVSVFLALLAALLLGLLFAFAYTKISNESYSVLSLASLMAFDALIKSWDTLTNGVLGMSVIRPDFISQLMFLTIALAIVAIALIIFEYILLQTHAGRLLRAHKENNKLLQAFGHSPTLIGMSVIVIAFLFSAVAGIFTAWRIQFLDPSFGGILLLLQLLTIAILAYTPRIFALIFSCFFVVMFPELLRFFDLPSAMVGHMRMLLYSVFIIVLIKFFAHKNISTRSS